MLTIDEEAMKLAQAHYKAESSVAKVFRINGLTKNEANDIDAFGLLEVNDFTISAGIMPVEFGPDPRDGYHCSAIIVEITPEEFDQIQSGELALPQGWSVGNEIPKFYHENTNY